MASVIIGMLLTFAMLGGAISLGGAPGAFLNGAGLLLVVAGTFTVSLVSFSWRDLRQTLAAIGHVLRRRPGDPADEARAILKLAERVRKAGGPAALGRMMPAFRNNPFLHQAMQMLVDGASDEELARYLDSEVAAIRARRARAATVLRRAGEIAPALGLIGTLIGLVQMLGRLETPSSLGPAMALAILTTLYGAMLAHVVLLPLADRLERLADEEGLVHRLYAAGARSIGRRENPRRLEMLLNSLLPPDRRVRYFE